MSMQITKRQAYKAMLAREPVWQISTAESRLFNPSVIPDSGARAFILEAGCPYPTGQGGKDMFGIEWEYDKNVGGSTVRPGNPTLLNANEWPDKLIWPDINTWDWSASLEKNRNFLDDEKFNIMALQNGWFERLISLMDFSGAVMALVDEDQTEAVHSLFSKLTETYIEILDRSMTCFPLIDGFWIHDDWGGQANTFFSPATCKTMIVPHMRRLTDYLHSCGKHCDFHSCGQLSRQVPNMINAGWDSWMPQSINDTTMLYENHGDKIIIGVTYPWPEPDASKEEQIQAVSAFVDKFCIPGKPCLLNDMHQKGLTPFVREELMRQSTEKFKV